MNIYSNNEQRGSCLYVYQISDFFLYFVVKYSKCPRLKFLLSSAFCSFVSVYCRSGFFSYFGEKTCGPGPKPITSGEDHSVLQMLPVLDVT